MNTDQSIWGIWDMIQFHIFSPIILALVFVCFNLNNIYTIKHCVLTACLCIFAESCGIGKDSSGFLDKRPVMLGVAILFVVSLAKLLNRHSSSWWLGPWHHCNESWVLQLPRWMAFITMTIMVATATMRGIGNGMFCGCRHYHSCGMAREQYFKWNSWNCFRR